MLKRLIVLALSLMIMLTTLVVAIPAYADFKDGDIVTISKSAGGGVHYNYNAAQPYYVSAMNATMEGSNATYFAWCASYGMPTPDVNRTYILCKENCLLYRCFGSIPKRCAALSLYVN